MKEMISIANIIDQQPIGRQQYFILLLCGLLMVLDGFDVQAMGYVAPAILQDWGIDKSELGSVFGASLFGLLIGSLVLSVVADKLGRRPVLIGATFFFAICMLLTPLADTVQHLVWIRFVTGLGLGAIMPNAMALCGEITPKHKRISVMMLISCGFTVGAMLGGVLAAILIPKFGWHSVFYFGGSIPLILAILMVFYLPESLQFMQARGADQYTIFKTLQRFFPSFPLHEQVQLTNDSPKAAKVPFIALFQNNRSFFTITIWLISMLNMIGLYFLSNWLPTLAKLTGLSLQTSVLLGSMLQLGGTIGTILMGWWIDKRGFFRILIPCFMLAVISVALIGWSSIHTVLLFAVVFVAGFAVVGGQPAINAMAANYYPTELRTTGVGWSLGVGRIGSVIGPVLGGHLVAMNLGMTQLFLFVAIPSVCIIFVLCLQKMKLKSV